MRLWSAGHADGIVVPIMGRLTTIPLPPGRRGGWIAYVDRAASSAFDGDWFGYEGVLAREASAERLPLAGIAGPPNLEYLGNEDVVHLFPDGTVQVLYRRSSEHNTILATERCNSFCLMCSQPPRNVDDSYRTANILRLLELISPEANEIGISGGEPTLLGQGLLDIVAKAERCLPATALHILTNGRIFKDASFARAFGGIRHHDVMLGIPLYSDVDWRHDYVLQAKGAYDETLAGFYNLARAGVRLELRVVLHRQTIERLPQLATFIARNLPFIEHVALMGLEMFGFTLHNLDEVWIDAADYGQQLEDATRTLALSGMRVFIYNHQLCTIPRSVWPWTVKSISDWKNMYLPECDGCVVRDRCGGFFQSATKRHSKHVRALALPAIHGHADAGTGAAIPSSP
jgi:His-Xaa-Ser system radical SAM maturase HxsC